MRIYTEFIIAKEAEKGKSRNEFHCGFSLLRDMRDERIANLQQALEQDDDDQDRQHPLNRAETTVKGQFSQEQAVRRGREGLAG